MNKRQQQWHSITNPAKLHYYLQQSPLTNNQLSNKSINH